jgi:hypothetical protein
MELVVERREQSIGGSAVALLRRQYEGGDRRVHSGSKQTEGYYNATQCRARQGLGLGPRNRSGSDPTLNRGGEKDGAVPCYRSRP